MSTSSIATPSGMVHEFSANLVVRRRSTVAKGVVTLDLGDPEGTDLPGWEPGAHVDLMLADGLVRQYSLCGDPREPDVWRVGVLLDPNSRGGSRYVHDNLVDGASVLRQAALSGRSLRSNVSDRDRRRSVNTEPASTVLRPATSLTYAERLPTIRD